MNENALKRHLASHATPETKGAAKKKPATIKAATRPARAPSPPPLVDDDDELDELEDDEGPVTSKSPSRPPTARATLDEILAEIKALMKSVNERRIVRLPTAGEEAVYEDVSFADKAAAIRAALQATRLLASMTGELGATESTVASSPYFKRMLQVILEAVSGTRFAEARQSIIAALEREERGGAREDVAA